MSELLDINDIAARWKVDRDYAMRYLVKKPDFPEPVPGSTRKQRRWKAQDIENYVSGHREHA